MTIAKLALFSIATVGLSVLSLAATSDAANAVVYCTYIG